jgi:glucosylglycerol-phosphate synthase
MEDNVIVLYHRPPFKKVNHHGEELYSEKIKPNGVIPTLKSFFATVQPGTWICWEESDLLSTDCRTMEYRDFVLKLIPVKKDEVNQFYNLTSKEGFWPILHSFTEKFRYDSVDWKNFVEINRRFANAAIECVNEDSIIWIHDYNLWMAPWFIRQQLPNVRIAFFHHTPFPSPDIFNILPWREDIIKSILCCDLCCFNIPRYVENFVLTAQSIVDLEMISDTAVSSDFCVKGALYEPRMTRQLLYNGRCVNLDAIPEGTDHHQINELINRNGLNGLSRKIKRAADGRKLIFSASRIDYIKGTVQMLHAFEALLCSRPDLRDKIVLCLISVEAADGMVAYNETQKEIEQLTGRINGKYATAQHTPILFFTENISFEEMIVWYENADILVIPSLRDGLNLVCKEYIAVKKGTKGVLILSEFAGAAVELEGALLTNPYSKKSLLDALEQAVEMDAVECQERMKKLYEKIGYSNVASWARQLDYLKANTYRQGGVKVNLC